VAVAFTADGKTAYVVSIGAGTVTPISTATNTPGRPIKVGAHPFAIAITP
jgi:hyaluronoglucosaminidase